MQSAEHRMPSQHLKSQAHLLAAARAHEHFWGGVSKSAAGRQACRQVSGIHDASQPHIPCAHACAQLTTPFHHEPTKQGSDAHKQAAYPTRHCNISRWQHKRQKASPCAHLSWRHQSRQTAGCSWSSSPCAPAQQQSSLLAADIYTVVPMKFNKCPTRTRVLAGGVDTYKKASGA